MCSLRSVLALFFKGIAIGSADVVPGVSGATLAYILNVYSVLIKAMRSLGLPVFHTLARRRRQGARAATPEWEILVPIFAGMVVGIIIFTKFIPLPLLLEVYPEHVYGLFLGLLGMSIILLLKQHKLSGVRDWVILLLAMVISFLLTLMIPTTTPETGWFIFLCGIIAICTMLMPGISGSFILLILGKYSTIFGAIGVLDFSIILPFFAGVICGLVFFSHFLYWLLKSFARIMSLSVIGLMIGSLYLLYPFQHYHYMVAEEKEKMIYKVPILPQFDVQSMQVILMMGLGAGIVYILHCIGKQKEEINV